VQILANYNHLKYTDLKLFLAKIRILTYYKIQVYLPVSFCTGRLGNMTDSKYISHEQKTFDTAGFFLKYQVREPVNLTAYWLIT